MLCFDAWLNRGTFWRLEETAVAKRLSSVLHQGSDEYVQQLSSYNKFKRLELLLMICQGLVHPPIFVLNVPSLF
jgi:hypothetical protein